MLIQPHGSQEYCSKWTRPDSKAACCGIPRTECFRTVKPHCFTGTEKRGVGCLGPVLGEGPSIKGPVFCACVAGEG